MRILSAERLEDAADAARVAAHRAAGDTAVVEIAPSGRWKVADVDRLTRPARLAGDAAVSVAVGLDDAPNAVWDRLLRIVEEPPVPWWLFVAVRSPDALPAPLRARALDTRRVVPTDPVRALTGAGWAPADAEHLAGVLGSATHLAADPAGGRRTVDGFDTLAAAVRNAAPSAAMGAIEQLAASDTESRRMLLRWVIDEARRLAAADARSTALAGSPTQHRDATRRLSAADAAAEALSRQANPAVVLWVLWPDG